MREGASAVGLVDSAATQTRSLVQGAETLPGGGLRPQASALSDLLIPQQTAPTLDDFVQDTGQEVLAPYAQQADNQAQFQQTVSGACTALDLVDALEAATLEEAASQIAADFGGTGTFRARVANLSSDLEDLRTSEEAAGHVAVFTICEAAGAAG